MRGLIGANQVFPKGTINILLLFLAICKTWWKHELRCTNQMLTCHCVMFVSHASSARQFTLLPQTDVSLSVQFSQAVKLLEESCNMHGQALAEHFHQFQACCRDDTLTLVLKIKMQINKSLIFILTDVHELSSFVLDATKIVMSKLLKIAASAILKIGRS